MSLARTMRAATQRRGLTYKPSAKEIKFLFDDVLDMHGHYKTCPEGVAEECTSEFIDDVINASAQLAGELLPLYQVGDQGCVYKDGNVTTPKGFKAAFDQYVEGGWNGLSYPAEYGGMNMPVSVTLVKNEILATANWSWFMYPGLTLGAANTILNHGNDHMKSFYLPKLVDLSWAGTMCLTEPHCGTDLAQIKTRAVEGDTEGTYKLTGTKIFISGGEQDLTENIVHIVLAKLPGAPEGTKGISLFLVPKYLPKEGGGLEEKKNVICGSIEKKMGIHGCSTAQLHFEDSVGWLIGEPNDGLRQMFTFMNAARLGTGIQGLAHMELAFQNAVNYATERTSMRSLSGTKDKDSSADAIIVHGDVRKMLMTSKAILEGSRCMLYDLGKMNDTIHYATVAGDEETAKKVEHEMSFLTPVAKGCVTEWSNEVAYACQQVYGGHGYIKDHGMEQILRDARIATLYEGTTGIQALDMLGRKMMIDKLKLFNKWNKKLRDFSWKEMTSGEFKAEGFKLYKLTHKWRVSVYRIAMVASKNRDVISASSVDHLFYSGYILLGYYWIRMANAASKKLKDPSLTEDSRRFYQTKIDTMKYYFSHVINRTASHQLNMVQPPDNLYKIDRNNFVINDA